LRASAPATADALWIPRRGTSSACAKRPHPPPFRSRGWRTGDTSFARAKGPCTQIVTTLLLRKRMEVARSRWYRGRVSLRKQEEPTPGSSRTGVARLAARHRSARKLAEAAWRVRKGRRSRPPSLRGSESSGWVARTSYAVAEVARRRVASNTLVHGAPKRATARVNGGLARRESRRSNVGDLFKRKRAATSDVIGHHGARIGAGPG